MHLLLKYRSNRRQSTWCGIKDLIGFSALGAELHGSYRRQSTWCGIKDLIGFSALGAEVHGSYRRQYTWKGSTDSKTSVDFFMQNIQYIPYRTQHTWELGLQYTVDRTIVYSSNIPF